MIKFKKYLWSLHRYSFTIKLHNRKGSIYLDDFIRNTQLFFSLLTSFIAIVGIVSKGANDLFIQIIKGKFRNNIERRSGLETIISGLWYVIIAFDILGFGLFIIIPGIGVICSAIKNKNIQIIKEIPKQIFSINQIETWKVVFSILLLLLMCAGIVGVFCLIFKIRKIYIKKIDNSIEEKDYKKIKLYKLFSNILAVISATGVLVFIWLIIDFLNENVHIEIILIATICFIINFISLIIYINFNEACEAILNKVNYIFRLKSGEVIICDIYLEYKNYYMILDKKLRYINKSEVTEISKE